MTNPTPIDIRPDHLAFVEDILQQHLCSKVKVWVYGSRAKWQAKDHSDLDLMLEQVDGEKIPFKTLARLQSDFEESDLPWKVDINDWHSITDGFKSAIKDSRVELVLSRKRTGWIDIKLGEFIELKRGYDLPKSKRRNGNIEIISSSGVSGYHDEYKINAPGVITGRYGTIGEVFYTNKNFWPLNTTLYVKDFKGNSPLFVYYLLKTLNFREYSDKAAVPGINRNHVHKAQIKVPQCPKWQHTIALKLWHIDSKIETNKQINQTLEQIAQAIFKSWFVDFDPVKAKIAAREALLAAYAEQGTRPSEEQILEAEQQAAIKAISSASDMVATEQLHTLAALFPNRLVDSELGEIPEGWGVKSVGDIVTRLKPKQRFTKKQILPYGLVPVFEQGTNILLGYHNQEAGFKASPDKPIFIFGDHTCITHLSCEPFDISANVIPLEGCNHPTLWVFQAVKDVQKFQEYRRHWSEFTIKKVVTASSELTEFYARVVRGFVKKKEFNIVENSSLKQILDTLLPKLLSGEIDLTNRNSSQ